jgi:branched-chain amino acid transport system ATP-binding protein
MMLQMRAVQAGFGSAVVLREVSIELARGATNVLVGRNGAGKTTLLRTIMGLVPIARGSLTLDDVDLVHQPAHARAALGVGYAPEDRRLIAGFTVEENLLLPLLALHAPAALRAQRLAEVYDLMPQLAELRARPGGYLSGGQGKMAALGRALMVGSRVVLLDEPFQGLAAALAHTYAETLGHVREQRKDLALLITESSPKLVRRVANAAFRIERGSVAPVDLDALV